MANKKRTNYKNPNRRTRSYLQIIYAESAPQNFIKLLEAEVDSGILAYFMLSPIHNLDRYDTKAANESLLRAQPIIEQAMNEITQWASQQISTYYTTMGVASLTAYDLKYKEYERIRQSIEEQERLLKTEKAQELMRKHTHSPGEPKKEHWHLIAEYTSKKSAEQATTHLHLLTGGTMAITRDDSLKAAVRYLAHLDENPNKKALYNPDDIYVYGDIKIERFLEEEDKSVRRHIVGGANRTLISAITSLRSCGIGTCRRLSSG